MYYFDALLYYIFYLVILLHYKIVIKINIKIATYI